MPETVQVFVYGHYDSRGGTTAVAAESREKADEVYNETMFSWSERKSQLVGDSRAAAQAVTESVNPELESPASQDFLYEAVLEARVIPGDGDLESEFDSDNPGEVWVLGDEESGITESDTPRRLMYVECRRWEDGTQKENVGYRHKEYGHDQPGDILEQSENPDYWDVYRMYPKVMVRCTLPDGSVHEFQEGEEERLQVGEERWSHPRWDDDAYSFYFFDAR